MSYVQTVVQQQGCHYKYVFSKYFHCIKICFLAVHQVLVHGLFHCKFCEKVFETEEAKKQHDREVHDIFGCVQCRQNFSSHQLLVKHRAERHNLYMCNFCDYNFVRTDLRSHHEKTHRMSHGIPVNEFYYDSKVHVIATTEENMKLKCILCDKILRSSKMINHIKYFHNFSNSALIECFQSTSLQYNIRDGSLNIQEDVPDPDNVMVTASSHPNTEYSCYICNIVYADCGAHLLFQVMSVIVKLMSRP